MWGGQGCGHWPANGWGDSWDWGWDDGSWAASWNSWPAPGKGQSFKGAGKSAAPPVSNIPPIRDVASMVSAQLFSGPPGGSAGHSGPPQGTSTAMVASNGMPSGGGGCGCGGCGCGLGCASGGCGACGSCGGCGGGGCSAACGACGGGCSGGGDLNSAALMAYQEMQQQAYGDEPDGGPFGGVSLPMGDIPQEVMAMTAPFPAVEEKIKVRLIEALKMRGDRWQVDLQDFKSCLARARNPAGFLIVKLSDMEKAINAERGNIGGPRELCANYRRGSCTRGDACKYSHDVPTGITKASVANLIAEAQKNSGTGGFGGFSSTPSPPAEGSEPPAQRRPERSRKASRSRSSRRRSRSSRRRRDSRSRSRGRRRR
ncbi:unnamed protein product [Effrenium voratum]|nr:unnamed protein product [Effrenium voratum]